MKKEKIFYDDERFKVTNRYLKTPRKTYQLNRIEKVSIVRDALFMGLAVSLGLILFSMVFGQYLKPLEVKIIMLLPALILWGSLRVGTLYITSKALAEPAMIWDISVLYKVRDALDQAIQTEGSGARKLDYEEDEDET